MPLQVLTSHYLSLCLTVICEGTSDLVPGENKITRLSVCACLVSIGAVSVLPCSHVRWCDEAYSLTNTGTAHMLNTSSNHDSWLLPSPSTIATAMAANNITCGVAAHDCASCHCLVFVKVAIVSALGSFGCPRSPAGTAAADGDPVAADRDPAMPRNHGLKIRRRHQTPHGISKGEGISSILRKYGDK